MSEEFVFKHRNRLKNHFVNVSKVLLYGYTSLSDGAKITFQVIDGYDWEDKDTGDSKGYVFPAVETLAQIRNTSVRTIQRHMLELIQAKLLTRIRRKYKPSILYIEEASDEEIAKYFASFEANKEKISTNSRNDKNVVSPKASETTKMSFLYMKEKEVKENEINVNEDFNKLETKKRSGMQGLNDILKHFDMVKSSEVKIKKKSISHSTASDKSQRDYYAQEIAATLQDQKSLGCYRVIAEKIPHQIIFEVLSSIKETAREGKIRVSKGALFVTIVQEYADKHGVELGFSSNNRSTGILEGHGGLYKAAGE